MSPRAMPPRTIEISVEGPTTLHTDGREVSLSRSERIVLAGLVMDHPKGIDAGTLLFLRWPDDAPRTARQALHNTISALRRKGGIRICHDNGRYRLTDRVSTDVTRLADIGSPGDGPHDLYLGRSPQWFGELPDIAPVRAAASRLDALLRQARKRSLDSLRRSGRHADAVALAHRLRLDADHDESVWADEISLLVAAGRRLDATATYREACRTLDRDHGLAPGPRLRALETTLWAGGETPSASPEGPTVRSRERSHVRGLLTAGRTVLLTGPEWIGKSRLASDVAARWPVGSQHLRCGESRCTPLAPLLEVADQVPPDVAVPVRRGAVDAKGLDRFVGLVTAGLADTTLLVLDDVDRLAPLSREVLGRVLRRCDVRVLATSRHPTTVPGRDDVHDLELLPLDVTRVMAMAGTDQRTSRDILLLTGGNPGFIVLLLEALDRSGVRPEMLPRFVELQQVPAPVGDALTSRLARLSTTARAIVEHLALFGGSSLTDDQVEQVHQQAPGLLRSRGNGLVELCHPLLRRVVVDSLPAGLRGEVELLAELTLARPQGGLAVAAAAS